MTKFNDLNIKKKENLDLKLKARNSHTIRSDILLSSDTLLIPLVSDSVGDELLFSRNPSHPINKACSRVDGQLSLKYEHIHIKSIEYFIQNL